ncbi:selenocysteine insertion sequence-binding protein 2-like [Pholidichthys leucotaenia]
MEKDFDLKHQRSLWKGPTDAQTPLVLPNPYRFIQKSRGNPSDVSLKPAGRGGDVSRGRGYSSNRPVRETGAEFLQKDGPREKPRAKAPKSSNNPQGRNATTNSVAAQRQVLRGDRSAPNSRGKPNPTQKNFVSFEVKLADFPELAGVSTDKTATPAAQKERWGPSPPSTTPPTPVWAASSKNGRGGSVTLRTTQPMPQLSLTDAKPGTPAIQTGQPTLTSWASIASQPPTKPVSKDQPIRGDQTQTEAGVEQQQEFVSGKKKRRKKKKAKSTDDSAEADSEEPTIPQEPPKFEDEEEFPGLTPAFRVEKLTTSTNIKLCNEENQREGGQNKSPDQNKEKSSATENAKKSQKAEKVSGKKSKAPVQLDIGNMLAVLEKKQQSQKEKQDAKPVILSVGGGLSVVQKQASVQKKPPWQHEKVAHNPLDSTSPLVKKGKQREVPKAKKPTPLKKVILKEREERKQRRLLEERGLLPENESKNTNNDLEEEQCDTTTTDEVVSSTEELDGQTQLNGQSVAEVDEETVQERAISPEQHPLTVPQIHSRKFRDYCSQMLSKDVDECVTVLLKELVRFQDRLYQKDPMKARMKRRIVMGLREVLKHLKLRKIKCVIISPNCERIQSKGGLDEALHTIINMCREQGVPFVFALSRKALGHCVSKAVPVSLVGIFNYDGAQDFYHRMIELSSEARTAYEVMVASLEQNNSSDTEQDLNGKELEIKSPAEEPQPQSEEPEYMKIWNRMLEKESSHMFLKEQLRSLHLDSDCAEDSENEMT